MYPIDVPDPQNARDWWLDIWEREIATFRFCSAGRIIVLAKIGVWDSLPAWHMSHPKDDFVEIDGQLAEDAIGLPEARDLSLSFRAWFTEPFSRRNMGLPD